MSKEDPGFSTFTTITINRLQETLKQTLEVGRNYEEIIGRFRKQGFRTLRASGLGQTILECKICGALGARQEDVKHTGECPMADITAQHS